MDTTPTNDSVTKSEALQLSADALSECEDRLQIISEILVPMTGGKESAAWEMGANRMIYTILMGMLEDSAVKERGMTREKFTIRNAINISSKTQNDCKMIYDWIDLHSPKSITRDLYQYYTPNARQTRDGFISSLAVKLKKWRNNNG